MVKAYASDTFSLLKLLKVEPFTWETLARHGGVISEVQRLISMQKTMLWNGLQQIPSQCHSQRSKYLQPQSAVIPLMMYNKIIHLINLEFSCSLRAGVRRYQTKYCLRFLSLLWYSIIYANTHRHQIPPKAYWTTNWAKKHICTSTPSLYPPMCPSCPIATNTAVGMVNTWNCNQTVFCSLNWKHASFVEMKFTRSPLTFLADPCQKFSNTMTKGAVIISH